MAVTKSTLNKSLPKASTIRFCTGLGKGMSIRLGTGESGKVGYYVGFKQPSKRTYGWQVQRRYRYMYSEAAAKKKGAEIVEVVFMEAAIQRAFVDRQERDDRCRHVAEGQ